MKLETEIATLETQAAEGELRVSDEVLRVVASGLRETLKTSAPDAVRALISQVVLSAELKHDEVALRYTALPLVDMAQAVSASVQEKFVGKTNVAPKSDADRAQDLLKADNLFGETVESGFYKVPLTGFEPVSWP